MDGSLLYNKDASSKFFPYCGVHPANDTDLLPRMARFHFTSPAEPKVSSLLSVHVISTTCDMCFEHHKLLDLKILIISNGK